MLDHYKVMMDEAFLWRRQQRNTRRNSTGSINTKKNGVGRKWLKGLWSNLRGLHPTRWSGGGRDWVVCPKTGRIASKVDPTLYVGVSKASPLVLVRKDSPDRLVFDIPACTNTMVLKSKNGMNIGLQTQEVQHWDHEIRYIEAIVSRSVKPVRVQIVDNNFLYLPHVDLTLDVSFWEYKQGNRVNFAGGKTRADTLLKGDDDDEATLTGRDWRLDATDGTLSPISCPKLVLGRGVRGLVLTNRPEDALILRDAATKLAQGQTIPMIQSNGGAIGTCPLESERQWVYRQCTTETDEPARIRWDGNFILLDDEPLVLDVASWHFVHGNTVNFVGAAREFYDSISNKKT